MSLESSETPGRIETRFRNDLGEINPYLCLIDSAVKTLISESETKSDKAKFLRIVAKSYGHHNIYTEHLNLDNLNRIVHQAHIAFINSKAESACEKIQRMESMLKEAKNIAEGDFLRKTLRIIYASKEGDYTLANTKNEQVFESYVGETELKILDYFRLIRNTELHNLENKSMDKILRIFDSIDQSLIKKKYKLNLSKPEDINFQDVLLLSKVWQEVIKKICKKCLNIKRDIYDMLKQKYKYISKESRRKNKITQILKQHYLQTDEEINIIMNMVG